MQHKRSLIIAFTFLVATKLLSQPTSEEIATALDDTAGFPWSIESAGDYTIEIIDDPQAFHGTALKITVPSESDFILKRNFDSEALVWFDYKIDIAETPRFYAYEGSGEMIPVPEDTQSKATWTTTSFQHRTVSTAGWRIAKINENEPDQVVYLDHFCHDPGYQVTIEGHGVNVTIAPDQPTFRPNESYVLQAEPMDDQHEFLYWAENGSRVFNSNPFDIKYPADPSRILLQPAATVHHEGVGGRRYNYGGLDLLVPLLFDITVTEGPDQSKEFDIVAETSDHVYLLLRATGPGFINFWAEGNGAVNNSSFTSSENEPFTKSIWFSPGLINFEMPVKGEVKLGGFEFVPGSPIQITTLGMGSVIGAPEGGFTHYGQDLTLTAIPDYGWEFSHWEGNTRIHDNPLTFKAYRLAELEAVFYRREALLTLPTKVFGNYDWTEELRDEMTVLKSTSQLNPFSKTALEWEVNGPGEFSFRYFSDDGNLGKLFIDGLLHQTLGSSGDESLNPFTIQLSPGDHNIRMCLENEYDLLKDVSFYIQDLRWSPGFPLTVTSTQGGSVTGIESETVQVLSGEEIILTAVAEEGYVFDSWAGDWTSPDATAAITIKRPLAVKAQFSKPISNDSWFDLTSGDTPWILINDTWHTPENLGEGQLSRISGMVHGPAYFNFDLEQVGSDRGGFVQWGYDNQVLDTTNSFGSLSIPIPEGEHRFFIEAVGDYHGDFEQRRITNRGLAYPVNITILSGSLTANGLINEHQPNLWNGRIDEGTEINYLATGTPGSEFKEWTGDLMGQPESGNFTVNNAITATGVFETRSITITERTLRITPSGNAFMPREGDVSIIDPDLPTTLSSNISGPVYFTFRPRELEAIAVLLDDEVQEQWPQSSSSTAKYFIPDGDHLLEIIMKADEDSYYHGSDPLDFQAGVRSVQFHPGYPVRGGKGVKMEPIEPFALTVAPGTLVTFTAEPNEGNEFIGWVEPNQSEANPFSISINDATQVSAIFRAESDVGGHAWEFTGNPTFAAPNASYPNGYLLFSLHPTEPTGTHSAKFSHSGPAVLEFLWWTNSPSQLTNPRFRVNGQTVELTIWPARLVLDDGPNEIIFEVDTPPLGESGGIFRLELPDVLTEFTVSATGEDAPVTLTPEKETYGLNEAITLMAPEINDTGNTFAGWHDLSSGISHSNQRVWNTLVQGNHSYVARYLPSPLVSNLASVTRETSNQWILDNSLLTPSNSPSLKADASSNLSIQATEPIVVNFLYKTEGNNPKAYFLRASSETIAEIRGVRDWKPYQIYLDAGERLFIRHNSNNPGTASYLGDLSFTSGWAPTIIEIAPEELIITPELSGLELNDIFTVSINPDSRNQFFGWMDGDGAPLSPSPERVGLFGQQTLFRPLFKDIAPPEGFTVLESSVGWVPFPPDTNFSDTTNWESRLSEFQETPSNRLDFSIQGPASVSFRVFTHSGDSLIETRLNDELIEGDIASRGPIPIPVGTHTLSFLHSSNDHRGTAGLIDLVYEPGIVVDYATDYKGGHVKHSPWGLLAPGEIIGIEVTPNAGWEFLGWESPHEDKPTHFTFQVYDQLDFVPKFKLKEVEFNTFGLHWKGHGVEVRSHTELSYDIPGIDQVLASAEIEKSVDAITWIESEVHGPAIFRMGPNFNVSVVTMTLDSVPILTSQVFSRVSQDGWLNLAIPKGSHKIRTEFLPEDGEFIPYYLVSVEGIGFQFGKAPSPGFFAPGSVITIEIPADIAVTDIEWMGLPPSAVISDSQLTFEVHDHSNIRGILWQDEFINGFHLQHAGNYQWIPDSRFGRYQMPKIRSGQIDILRLKSEETGILKYDANLPDYDRIRLEVALNGATLSSTTGDPIGSDFITLNGEEDEVTWTFHEMGNNIGGFDSWSEPIYLGNLEILKQLSDTPYKQWMDAYKQEELPPNELLRPDWDLNNDGVKNYLSFLLGEDPYKSLVLFGVERNQPSGTLTLWHPNLPEELLNTMVFEYSYVLVGEWMDASPILSEPYQLEGSPNIIYCDVLLAPEGSQDVFFRLRYLNYIPPLNNLIEP